MCRMRKGISLGTLGDGQVAALRCVRMWWRMTGTAVMLRCAVQMSWWPRW